MKDEAMTDPSNNNAFGKSNPQVSNPYLPSLAADTSDHDVASPDLQPNASTPVADGVEGVAHDHVAGLPTGDGNGQSVTPPFAQSAFPSAGMQSVQNMPDVVGAQGVADAQFGQPMQPMQSMPSVQPMGYPQPVPAMMPQQPYGIQQPGMVPGTYGYPTYPMPALKSRLVVALLAFFFGIFGVHDFYAGYVGRGIAKLALTLVGFAFILTAFIFAPVVWVWCIIDMIMVITGTGWYARDGRGLPFS